MDAEMQFFIWMIAATLNLAIASVVVCIMISGKSAYRYVGAGGKMAKALEAGWSWPRIGSFVALLFFGFVAVLCLGQAGLFWFPMGTVFLALVTIYYLLRASVLFFDKYINPPLPTFVLMTSYSALLVGIVQSVGLMFSIY